MSGAGRLIAPREVVDATPHTDFGMRCHNDYLACSAGGGRKGRRAGGDGKAGGADS